MFSTKENDTVWWPTVVGVPVVGEEVWSGVSWWLLFTYFKKLGVIWGVSISVLFATYFGPILLKDII